MRIDTRHPSVQNALQDIAALDGASDDEERLDLIGDALLWLNRAQMELAESSEQSKKTGE